MDYFKDLTDYSCHLILHFMWPCSLEVRYLLWVITTASGLGSIPSKAQIFMIFLPPLLNILVARGSRYDAMFRQTSARRVSVMANTLVSGLG
jgi:hypothetical protein